MECKCLLVRDSVVVHLTKAFITEALLHDSNTHTHTQCERRIKGDRVTVRATVSRMRSSDNCCLIQMVDGALSQVLLYWTLREALNWCNNNTLEAMLEVFSSVDCSVTWLTCWPTYSNTHMHTTNTHLSGSVHLDKASMQQNEPSSCFLDVF